MHLAPLVLSLLVISFSAYAEDSPPGVTTHLTEVVVADGARLTARISLPERTKTRLHPLLFTQWVSCDTLEYRQGSNSKEVLASLARDSGLALVSVERSALGNSGPACSDLDYTTERQHYVDAFKQLLGDQRIDASKVFVYGSSLGATTAPLVALELQEAGHEIAGIVVQGGGGLTHFERMLNFDRLYLERRPEEVAPENIHAEILSRARFQYEYLVRQRHPDEIAKDSPDMANVRHDTLGMSESDHYGRPYAWHQQAARENFLGAWAQLDAAVLVIFNAFDQFEVRHGHQLIVDTVERLRPGSATYVERPNVGHGDNRYATIEDAYAWRDGEPVWQETAELMVDWLGDQL